MDIISSRVTADKEKTYVFDHQFPLFQSFRPYVTHVSDTNLHIVKSFQKERGYNYASCFPPHFHVSHNLLTLFAEEPVTADSILLHSSSKQGRYLLALPQPEEGLPPAQILLSEHDAAFFKKWLSAHPEQEGCLLDIEGHLELPAGSSFYEKYQQVLEEGVWYANFFNGRIDYLRRHQDLFKRLLHSQIELMTEFMAARVSHDPHLMAQFASSRLFAHSIQQEHAEQGGILFSARREQIERSGEWMLKRSPEEMRNLSPRLIAAQGSDFPVQCIVYLKGKQQIEALHPHLACHLSKEQLQSASPEQIRFLSSQQIEALNEGDEEIIRHLTGDQLLFLSERGWSYLSEAQISSPDFPPQGIGRLSHEHLYLLHPNLLGHVPLQSWSFLTESQREQIPSSYIQRVLAPDEIQLIRKSPFIKKWSEEQVVQFLQPEEVALLDETQLPWVPVELAHQLTDPMVLKRFMRESLLHKLSTDQLVQQLSLQEMPPLSEKLSHELLARLPVTYFISRRQLPPPCLFGLMSIEQLQQIPDDLIPISTPDSLQRVLSDEQWRALYDRESFKKGDMRRAAIGSVIALPRLVFGFLFNLICFTGLSTISPFSRSTRQRLPQWAAETFLHAPCRAFAFLYLFSHVNAYQRFYWLHRRR